MENQYILSDNNQLKDFQCPVCFKYFSRKFTLDMHLLIHKGVKPHQCPFCDKSFRQKGTLMRHKALHSASNLFYCNLCDRGFRQKNVFLHHLKHRHSVSTECLDRRKYRTEVKDYQSIMDTLPSFVHADSTAIASSEKHLDAMLLESLNNSVCDSSISKNLPTNIMKNSANNCLEINSSIVKSNNYTFSNKSLQYQCIICLKYYREYSEYKMHVENYHDDAETLLDCKPVICDFPSETNDNSLNGDTNPKEPRGSETLSSFASSVCQYRVNKGKVTKTELKDSIENMQVCIPCHDSFSSVEEFESHVKTHVQSVILEEANKKLAQSNFCNSTNDISDINKSKEKFKKKHLHSSNLLNSFKDDDGTSDTITNSKPILFANNVRKGIVPHHNFLKRFNFNTSLSSSGKNNNQKIELGYTKIFSNKFQKYDKQNYSKNKDVNSSYILGFDKNLYICKTCDKSFQSKVMFEYHKQLHLYTRGFSCGYCKRKFSTKKLLLSHTRSKHMKTFQCLFCSRSFNYRSLYDSHQRKCSKNAFQAEDVEKLISLPLLDIKEIINSNTKDVVGVIPIGDGSSEIKIGIPIISLQSLKAASYISTFSAFQIKGCIKINRKNN